MFLVAQAVCRREMYAVLIRGIVMPARSVGRSKEPSNAAIQVMLFVVMVACLQVLFVVMSMRTIAMLDRPVLTMTAYIAAVQEIHARYVIS